MTTSEQIPSKDTKCDNCGEELLGTFCWVCGQKDSHYNRSLFKIIGDFFKEMFDVDSRVFTTLSTLFLRPGTLSIQFRENKRASYVTPIRLYLFSSLVFFFLVAITSQSANVQVGEENAFGETDVSQGETAPTNDEIRVRTQKEIDDYLTSIRSLVRLEENIFESAKNVLKGRIAKLEHDPWSQNIFATIDKMQDGIGFMGNDLLLREDIQRAVEAHKRMRVLQEFFLDEPVTLAMGEAIVKTDKQGELISLMEGALSRAYAFHHGKEFHDVVSIEKSLFRVGIHSVYNGKEFLEDMTENLPLMMFVLLPIFVSLLALLSLGKGIRVVFQLIFAMHIHALAFITLTLSVLLSLLFKSMDIPLFGDIVFLLFTLSILVHVYLSFKNFYASGHLVSLLKYTLLIIGYSVILLVSLVTMAIYIFLTPAL